MQKHQPDPHTQNVEQRSMECAPFENNVNYPAPHGSLIQQGMERLEQTHGVHGAKQPRHKALPWGCGQLPREGMWRKRLESWMRGHGAMEH